MKKFEKSWNKSLEKIELACDLDDFFWKFEKQNEKMVDAGTYNEK